MVAQCAITLAQRGAKRQPVKVCVSDGTVPAMAVSGSPRRSASGSARSSACAYGCFGARKNSAAVATSTICPAYISATRCAMPETTARSCVISSRPMPCSLCRSRSRSRICFWIVTSSAVVGSSATRKSGSVASVIAIITRCFWPPLMRNGYSSMRRSGSGMPTRFNQSMALARAASPRRSVWASIASTIWSPTFITGFRLVDGS